MILESVTIQLLILSRRRRSTGWEGQLEEHQEGKKKTSRLSVIRAGSDKTRCIEKTLFLYVDFRHC